MGPREYHDVNSSGSDMEARYEDIEEEEKRAAKIAHMEDMIELRREEEQERRRREKKRLRRFL